MRTVATIIAVAALAIPAAAGASTYYSDSAEHGGKVVTKGATIDTLWIFCKGHGYDNGILRFDTAYPIDIGRKGRFSYSGVVYRYGPESQPRGQFNVKLSGRVIRSKTVHVKWKLPGCSPGTSTINFES